ncbi:MAG: hypothetical protein WCJ69_14700 [Betaproteobacteria bacterium]
MFRRLRILILLVVLVNVGVGGWLLRVRTAAWDHPLRVAVFPVAADRGERTRAFVAGFGPEALAPVERFLADEARRHGLSLTTPVEFRVHPGLAELPPEPPFGGSRLDVFVWSLRLRAWVWRHGSVPGPAPHARLFLLFHDPALGASVPHSVGLPQGLIGVVHGFATRAQASQNAVVLAHELLHTVGATDKYDPATNLPRFPDGYAEPDRSPRHPQEFAELMGGRLPVSAREARMPESLDEVLVGEGTAREIGWRR